MIEREGKREREEDKEREMIERVEVSKREKERDERILCLFGVQFPWFSFFGLISLVQFSLAQFSLV